MSKRDVSVSLFCETEKKLFQVIFFFPNSIPTFGFHFIPAKKSRNPHRQARVPSPSYSTDSNYGSADRVRKPYPKSQRRRKQMSDQGRESSSRESAVTNGEVFL